MAAFKLGISRSAAMSSKKVGLWEPSPPTVKNDMLYHALQRSRQSHMKIAIPHNMLHESQAV